MSTIQEEILQVTPELVGTWDIDPEHSSVGFAVKHAMVATTRGWFTDLEGAIEVRDPVEASTVEARIRAASIDTRIGMRDEHLRSPDFLEVERYPEISFRSRSIERTGPETALLHGDLTIRGVTKPVTLQVTFSGLVRDDSGNLRAGAEATATINRKEWGLTWNMALEAGGVLVSDKVRVMLDISAVKRA